MLHTYNGILFGLTRREILTYATTWLNSEDFMLGEISQTQNTKKINTV